MRNLIPPRLLRKAEALVPLPIGYMGLYEVAERNLRIFDIALTLTTDTVVLAALATEIKLLRNQLLFAI